MKQHAFRTTIKLLGLFLAVSVSWPAAGEAQEVFRIGIMQSQKDAARQYRPLEAYLQGKNIPVTFVAAKSYPDAAEMVARGDIDGMFSGSGVAGTMILKGLAEPVLRPVADNGSSTYWALLIAPQGAPLFTGEASYFQGKKVLATALASSGEFFYRSLPGIGQAGGTLLYAANHGAAIDALSKGAADLAIVKNWTWESLKGQYPTLQVVGKDAGENPDMTLIVAKKADRKLVEKVRTALLALKADQGAAAQAVRDEMKISHYIPTTEQDFTHNLALLRRAGVDAKFNFEFK
ncbi:MAG: PhnD/SsuA/transferrin family substrate-binding protein [Desulfuromonadales bacterium]|nr:PhnD/SsuA/transferrin family substrate-binding protein [Desulfuromonadales bacterium]